MMYISQFIIRCYRKLTRRLRDLYYLYKGYYRRIPNIGKLALHCSVPMTMFSPNNSTLIHNADFLPDRLTFSGKLFEKCPHFSFAKGYINDQYFNYKETDYYRLAMRGHLSYPCRGEKHATERCKKYIYLINRIRKEGYRPEKFSPIILIECADGTIAVGDGKHRLAALLVLGIKEFPVVFCYDNEAMALGQEYVNQSWPLKFYEKSLQVLQKMGKPLIEKEPEINNLIKKIKMAKLETWADIYHPIPFYEFRDLTTQVTKITPYKRLGMILSRYSDLSGKRVLDLGCNVGFYSFSLAKRGAYVTGIDLRREYIEIASKVSRIYEIPVEFINRPVTPEFFEENNGEYDITLCFSMLQWVIDQKGIEYGMNILTTISDKSKALFFDTSVNSGKSCLKSKEGEELAFVYDLLRRSTSYKEINHIGDVHTYGNDTRYVFFCNH